MGDPRSENWCYGCSIDCRSITIAMNQCSIPALGAIRAPMVSSVGNSPLDARGWYVSDPGAARKVDKNSLCHRLTSYSQTLAYNASCRARTQARDKILDQWRLFIAPRQARECPRLDTNRETADQCLLTIHIQGDVAASRLEHPGFRHLIEFGNQITDKILNIAFRLEADYVVLHE